MHFTLLSRRPEDSVRYQQVLSPLGDGLFRLEGCSLPVKITNQCGQKQTKCFFLLHEGQDKKTVLQAWRSKYPHVQFAASAGIDRLKQKITAAENQIKLKQKPAQPGKQSEISLTADASKQGQSIKQYLEIATEQQNLAKTGGLTQKDPQAQSVQHQKSPISLSAADQVQAKHKQAELKSDSVAVHDTKKVVVIDHLIQPVDKGGNAQSKKADQAVKDHLIQPVDKGGNAQSKKADQAVKDHLIQPVDKGGNAQSKKADQAVKAIIVPKQHIEQTAHRQTATKELPNQTIQKEPHLSDTPLAVQAKQKDNKLISQNIEHQDSTAIAPHAVQNKLKEHKDSIPIDHQELKPQPNQFKKQAIKIESKKHETPTAQAKIEVIQKHQTAEPTQPGKNHQAKQLLELKHQQHTQAGQNTNKSQQERMDQHVNDIIPDAKKKLKEHHRAESDIVQQQLHTSTPAIQEHVKKISPIVFTNEQSREPEKAIRVRLKQQENDNVRDRIISIGSKTAEHRQKAAEHSAIDETEEQVRSGKPKSQVKQQQVKPKSHEGRRPQLLHRVKRMERKEKEKEAGQSLGQSVHSNQPYVRSEEEQKKYQLALLQKLTLKKKLLEDLRRVDVEIKQLRAGAAKSEESAGKKEEKQEQNHRIQEQRRRIQLAKKKQQQKEEMYRQQLRVKEQEWNRLKEQRKEEKRLEIQRRIEEIEKRKVMRIELDKQSNKVLASLKDGQRRRDEPHLMAEVEEVKSSPSLGKKEAVRLKDIKEHQRKYYQNKELIKQKAQAKRQESKEHAVKAPNFQKSVFSKQVQEEDRLKKELEERTRQERQFRRIRKQKYSEEVNQFFKDFTRKSPDQQAMKETNNSKQARQLSKEPIRKVSHDNIKKPEKAVKGEVEKGESVYHVRQSNPVKDVPPLPPTQKKPKPVQSAVRKSKVQSIPHPPPPQPKPQAPKYKNYLTEIKHQHENKKTTYENWKKVLQNKDLSEEDRFQRVIQKAGHLEQIAKRKQIHNDEDEQGKAIDLYLQSINAKLALLQLKNN